MEIVSRAAWSNHLEFVHLKGSVLTLKLKHEAESKSLFVITPKTHYSKKCEDNTRIRGVRLPIESMRPSKAVNYLSVSKTRFLPIELPTQYSRVLQDFAYIISYYLVIHDRIDSADRRTRRRFGSFLSSVSKKNRNKKNNLVIALSDSRTGSSSPVSRSLANPQVAAGSSGSISRLMSIPSGCGRLRGPKRRARRRDCPRNAVIRAVAASLRTRFLALWRRCDYATAGTSGAVQRRTCLIAPLYPENPIPGSPFLFHHFSPSVFRSPLVRTFFLRLPSSATIR